MPGHCGAHSSLSKDKHSWWSSEPLDGQGTMTRSFVMLESAGRVIDEGQSRAVLQDWSVNLDIQYWLASREFFSQESGLHRLSHALTPSTASCIHHERKCCLERFGLGSGKHCAGQTPSICQFFDSDSLSSITSPPTVTT